MVLISTPGSARNEALALDIEPAEPHKAEHLLL